MHSSFACCARPGIFEVGFLTRGFVKIYVKQHGNSVSLCRLLLNELKIATHHGSFLQGIGFMYQQHKVLVEINAAGNLEGTPAGITELCYTP